MGAVLDLEKGRVTFKKLGVTMDLGESTTGHHEIDLIPDCVDPISDGMALENAPGSVRRHRGATAKDSGNSSPKQGVLEPALRFRESDNH